jgi:hypothetical protein
LQALDVLQEVLLEQVDREVRDRSRLRRRDVAGVADGEDVVVLLAEQRVLVDRYVVEVVSEAGRR